METIKNDEWLLLDEINLAPDEVLLRLISILEGKEFAFSEGGNYYLNQIQLNIIK